MRIFTAAAITILTIGALTGCAADTASSLDTLAGTTLKAETTSLGEIQSSENTSASRPHISGTAQETKLALKCNDKQILLHCQTTNQKEIMLCDNGRTLEYSFGEVGASPDLALSVPRNQARTFQWQGFGRWINYSVTVANDDAKYTVFTSVDRMDDAHRFEAGVVATVDNEEVARVLCKSPVKHALEGVDLKRDE